MKEFGQKQVVHDCKAVSFDPYKGHLISRDSIIGSDNFY